MKAENEQAYFLPSGHHLYATIIYNRGEGYWSNSDKLFRSGSNTKVHANIQRCVYIIYNTALRHSLKTQKTIG